MGSALGAGRGADALMAILRQKYAESTQAQQLANDRARIDNERARITGDQATRQQAADALAEQRTAMAGLRNQQAADRLAAALPVGAELDADSLSALRAGNLGPLIRHEDSTLPSTAYQGIADTGSQAPLRIRNLARTMNAGHGERDVYAGTQAQQQAAQQRASLQRLASDPNTPADVRQYLGIMDATGSRGSLPSALFQEPNQDVYERGPNGSMQKIGTVPRGSRVVNAPRPTADPNARARNRLAMDDPSYPRGVQDYVSTLRGKYDTFADALSEFNRALPNMRAAHPDLSPDKALDALRQQYSGGGRPPSGADALLDSILSGAPAVGGGGPRAGAPGGARASGGGGRGGPATSSRSAGGGGDKAVSRAELEAIAARRGTSVEQERQRAAASGYVVR